MPCFDYFNRNVLFQTSTKQNKLSYTIRSPNFDKIIQIFTIQWYFKQCKYPEWLSIERKTTLIFLSFFDAFWVSFRGNGGKLENVSKLLNFLFKMNCHVLITLIEKFCFRRQQNKINSLKEFGLPNFHKIIQIFTIHWFFKQCKYSKWLSIERKTTLIFLSFFDAFWVSFWGNGGKLENVSKLLKFQSEFKC